MSKLSHLWAIGYDDIGGAERVREKIIRLRGPEQALMLLDTAVVVRHADGSLTIDREPFSVTGNILGFGMLGFLAGLVVAAPLTGAAIGALVGSAGSAIATKAGIDEAFIREVSAFMRPGTSVLFVLDDEGDMDLILHAIRGLGGTVLKTNVDVERAKLIQSTLTSKSG